MAFLRFSLTAAFFLGLVIDAILVRCSLSVTSLAGG